jgi:Peptidase family M28
MAASRPPNRRRRPRRGSLERPVNARLYRGTWLLVALPLLLAAFSVSRPTPLPRPVLPPAFDVASARDLARELASKYPDRSPGTSGATGAALWVRDRLDAYGLETSTDTFAATIPGIGRRTLTNVVALARGASAATIVVAAHRDDIGTGTGANDNASGTAALIELARLYATSSGGESARSRVAEHTIAFVSTDGGAFGALGAEHFADSWRERNRVVAVVDLDSIAGGAPRLELAGDAPRSPAATLVATAAQRLLEQTGREPRRPSALAQLVDLGFPLSLYEQAPFVGRGIPAVTLTTAASSPPDPFTDRPSNLRTGPLGQIGTAAQQLLASLDQGLELAQGTTSYVFLGSRIVRGWALEIVLIAMLLPFLVVVVDLFARCRRRRIALTPAVRSLRGRLGFWLYVALLFGLLVRLGAFPDGAARPPSPDTQVARDWPMLPISLLIALALVGWLVARDRLLPRRPLLAEEELAGHAVALLALGVVGLVVAAANPFALLFVLPSLHAWLWAPHVVDRQPAVRLGVVALGALGPLLLLWSVGVRFGLGLDAPWYLAELVVLGYAPFTVVLIGAGWAACAGQLAALAVGRYAPYPERHERLRLGPLRRVVRHVALGVRARRAEAERRRAVGG